MGRALLGRAIRAMLVVALPLGALSLGFTATLLGGAGLVLVATLAVLCVPEVRHLTRIQR